MSRKALPAYVDAGLKLVQVRLRWAKKVSHTGSKVDKLLYTKQYLKVSKMIGFKLFLLILFVLKQIFRTNFFFSLAQGVCTFEQHNRIFIHISCNVR